MTTRLAEVRVHWIGIFAGWRIETFGPGYPPPDLPIHTDTRYWKPAAIQAAREEQRRLWVTQQVASEMFVYARSGRIEDRRTYPRSHDPIRSKG